MDYYNQKRCVDGKGLVLPSQIVSSLCNVLIRWRIGDSGVITIEYHFFFFFLEKMFCLLVLELFLMFYCFL